MSTVYVTKRSILLACASVFTWSTIALAVDADAVNLAPAAKLHTSFVSGHERLEAISDGVDPRNSQDHNHGAYGNWPSKGTQWVEYEWTQPISTNGVDVYWWDDNQGIRMPVAGRLSYWDGSRYVPIESKVGVEKDKFNRVEFSEIKTTKLRLEIDAQSDQSSGMIEWRVYDTGTSPAFPPISLAGVDRVVVLPAVTYLEGTGKGIARKNEHGTGTWSKVSGPGEVKFENANKMHTTASFTEPGEYELKFAYSLRGLSADDTVSVTVENKPTVAKLNAVYVSKYKINSPFWNERLKNQIVNWIPHCVAKNEDPSLKEGGINNLIEAGKKLRGEPAKPHVGYPFANAWVLNTAEAMCVALTLDPQGDKEIIAAQESFRATLDKWIPIILAAQEPDGYFQTRYTLGSGFENRQNVKPQRWDARLRSEHEGYIAGYFIEMGIAHYIATEGNDRRLYDASIKLADCWVNNLGPSPKKPWYDGHQEVEQALVRLGRFVNDLEGQGKGQKYIDLAKFLLDSRSTGEQQANAEQGGDFYTGGGGGDEYDQSHRPITQHNRPTGSHSIMRRSATRCW